MPAYRSRTTTRGRNMAGPEGLWRETGMKDGDFGKPNIAICNSLSQFVPVTPIGKTSAMWWRARSRQPAASPGSSRPSSAMTVLPWRDRQYIQPPRNRQGVG